MMKEVKLSRKDWADSVSANPDGGDVLQTLEFAEAKSSSGWFHKQLVFEQDGQKIYILVLIKKTVFGQVWYTPKGPGSTNLKQLNQLLVQLFDYAEQSGAFFVKIEPPIDFSQAEQLQKSSTKLIKTKNIQYNADTVVIDLKQSEDEILASFKQRARRAIRKAEKAGLVVEEVEPSLENLKQFYKLYKQTSERAGFFIRNEIYYLKFWQIFTSSNMGKLFLAKLGPEFVSGAFILNNENKALYKDGASVRIKDSEGSAYLLHWEIIKRLKKAGIKEYDLHGTPPPDKLEDKTHPFHSIGRFKTAFSQEVTSYLGAYDLIIKPKQYKLWSRLGLRFYQAWEHKIKKQTFY